jgi:hypothetical protein
MKIVVNEVPPIELVSSTGELIASVELHVIYQWVADAREADPDNWPKVFSDIAEATIGHPLPNAWLIGHRVMELVADLQKKTNQLPKLPNSTESTPSLSPPSS